MVPENVSPAMMAPPKPCHKGSESVIGSKPTIAQTEVKAIGSSLEDAASATDSVNSIPDSKLILILSTTKIEFLTTIPNSAKIPIRAGKDKGIWAKAKTIKTPEIDSGITNITIKAFLKDENCKTIVMMINRKDKIIA